MWSLMQLFVGSLSGTGNQEAETAGEKSINSMWVVNMVSPA